MFRKPPAYVCLSLILVLSLGTTSLFAETLLLFNGEIVRGRITAEDQNTILIQTDSGPRSFERREIRKIFYSEAQEDAWRKSEALPSRGEARADLAEDDHNSNSGTAWRAAAWNLFLPGSAQWRRGQSVRGGASFGATVAALYRWHYTHRRFLNTQNVYNTVADSLYVWPANFVQSLAYGYQLNYENQIYSRLKARSAERAQAGWLFVAIYLWQLADALWSAPDQQSASKFLGDDESSGAFRLDFASEAPAKPGQAAGSASDDRMRFVFFRRF